MPWLSDEIPDWEALSEEERNAFREIVRELGMEFPSEPEENDPYE
ncbi:MAG: hypothetical protein NVSMB51_07940 [Solirubrobacteraceae bacterium]